MGNDSAGFIYLMKAVGTDLYKIGMMSSLEDRIADVRSQHPSFQIQYERSLRVNGIREAKNYFYTRFADYRYDLLDKFSNITEWFLFPPAVLDQVLSEFDEDKDFEEESNCKIKGIQNQKSCVHRTGADTLSDQDVSRLSNMA